MLRALTKIDSMLSVSVGVFDAAGTRVLTLSRPAALWKSTLTVTDGSGAEVGRIVQRNMIGKIRFGLEDTAGRPVGEIRAENWRAWDFAILDPSEREVGRITKKWGGLGREMFTTADNYVLEVSNPEVDRSIRLFMLAAAAAIDTVLKQTGAGALG